ncbi:FAD:protein FMN transferase [Pseudoalteromonas sp. G4]|uniref:FAD:protein FMN transferase n=1 Tax=Pseudoalteromonas sp. G4 TaxID=2992761 RepID=UPI00237E8C31|nr:FAD:protein FMN transferase [Pseudoalteromonas sp. G4]MDE3271626.1 FAD:protein FMN transferase [Pseudoalteromonas sp. G4]
MKRFYYSVFFLFLFLLAACDQAPNQSKMQEVLLQGKTMGTTFTIKVFVPEEKVTELSLFSDVTKILKDVNQSMSTYIPDSEINQFNRLPAGQNFIISEDFRRVTAESIRLGVSTGTLDVTMGPLIDLWGFGPDNRPETIPSDAIIAEIKQRIGVDKLKLTPNGLMKTVDGLEVSYSATAKGFGIDKVAEYLDSLSLTNYMVEIGGEIRTSGHKPNHSPWVLAIEQPDAAPGTREFHKLIRVNDIAMATSGDYRIFYDVDGVHYSHLIHPETGKPVRQDLVSVTVLHSSAMTADGLATALTVMGTEQAKLYAEQHNLPVYLISKTPEGLVTFASKAFEPYL